MADQTWQDWFENAWEVREENIYPSLFGDTGSGIYTLDADLFMGQFRQTSVDPRRFTYGVFESRPSARRASWLYVSSGLSNAWEADSPKPDEVSGLGCEFIIECPSQSMWALLLLRQMVAFQILLSVGRFEEKGLLEVWDRIPLHAPIDGTSSELKWSCSSRRPASASLNYCLQAIFNSWSSLGSPSRKRLSLGTTAAIGCWLC